jgi:hypothetical protein
MAGGNNYKRGATFERDRVKHHRAEGRAAYRTAGSHTPADVIVLWVGGKRLEQTKTGGTSPYSDFGPAARERLLQEAALAGGTCSLVWKKDGKVREIPPEEWPDGG